MIPDAGCYVIDVEYPNEIINVVLPDQLSAFLTRACVDESALLHYDNSKTTLVGGIDRPAETREEKTQALLESIKRIPKVMDCPATWPDADRIRSALEWGFESEENSNQTFAFIQACIGLEALLGDDDKDEPLTTRLADRCAYLLGSSHKDRQGIRRLFKDMYDVRSKLVHGRTPKLGQSDALELHHARHLLGDVIDAEVTMLVRALEKAEKLLTNRRQPTI